MTGSTFTSPGWAFGAGEKPRPAARTCPPPPAPPGPALIGDTQMQIGGRPLLLHLWEAWSARREDREPPQ